MPATDVFELEVLDGVGPFAMNELDSLPARIEILDDDATSIRLRGEPTLVAALVQLRTVVAAYVVLTYDIPRPKALLGEQHVGRLEGAIDDVRARATERFSSFRISAAGRESTVFTRLADELETRCGLTHDPDDGDMLVRVRPSKLASSGWDVLLRTTPRPLSKRPWRVQNHRGALNATIAAAIIELSRPTPGDAVLNPMCGSGTLLIERLARGPVARLAACDTDPDALIATRANLAGGKVRTPVDLWPDDATHLDRIDGPTFDRVVVDLPWGTLVGTHENNAQLYPAFLTELARVTTPDAIAVVLTHEIKLFERTMRASDGWSSLDELRFFQKGHHPRAYVLTRR